MRVRRSALVAKVEDRPDIGLVGGEGVGAVGVGLWRAMKSAGRPSSSALVAVNLQRSIGDVAAKGEARDR